LTSDFRRVLRRLLHVRPMAHLRVRKQRKALINDKRAPVVRLDDTQKNFPELCCFGERETEHALKLHVVEELFVFDGRGGLDAAAWATRALQNINAASVHRICEDSGSDRRLVTNLKRLRLACILTRPMQLMEDDEDQAELMAELIRFTAEQDQSRIATAEQDQSRIAAPSDEDQLSNAQETGTGIAALLLALEDTLVRECGDDASAIAFIIQSAFQGSDDCSDSERMHEAVSSLTDYGALESARELQSWWQALSAADH